jgi:hypothetical protein
MPILGLRGIMDWLRDEYGRDYAPNTRETFRRSTLHQFAKAGLIVPNPDLPNRPINSPKWCYQIAQWANQLLVSYELDGFEHRVVRTLQSRS